MKNLKNEYKNAIILTLAMLVMAIGLNLFFIPAGVFTTGTMGLAQEISNIIERIANISNSNNMTTITSIVYLLINAPIIVLGWYKVGKKFTIRTFFAITMLSIFTAIIPADHVYVTEPLLAIITGSILIGLATGLSLKIGASSGGTDIIALYISLFWGKSFGVFNFIINVFVIIIAVMLTGDLTTGVLMMMSIFTISTVIDKVHTSQEKRTIFCVTREIETVREALLKNHMRGITIFNTEGGLTKEQSHTIMITVELGELYAVIDTIKTVDSRCFINVYKVEALFGDFINNYQKKL